MRRLVLLTLAAVLVPALCAAQADTAKLTLRDIYKNVFHIDTSAAITGTWSGAVNSTQLTEDASAGDAQTDLAAGDVIMVGGYSYKVASEPPDANTIVIVPVRDPNTGALRAGLDAAVTSRTIYLINHGITGTSETVLDGAGTATALSLSTTTVGAAALEVGGGYSGGSGTTIDNAGNVSTTLQVRAATFLADTSVTTPQANGAGGGGDLALVGGSNLAGVGGDVTLGGGTGTGGVGSVLVAGGAGSSGVTISDAGAITADGAAALNGGISVDSTAFVVTDTTGAVSTASTVTATNYRTSTAAAGLGTANGLSLGNSGILLDGATGGGNTLTVGFPTYADASDGAISNAEFLVSQPGASWYNDSTLTNGQSGIRYKISGDLNGGSVDADGTILTSAYTDSTAHNLTGSILSITRANVLDAGGYDGQRSLEITVGDGPDVDNGSGGGNAIYIKDNRTVSAESDDNDEAAVVIDVASTAVLGLWTDGAVSVTGGITSGASVLGTIFQASSAASTAVASRAAYGLDGIQLEGATGSEADELKLNFPTYSDGGAGDQGGEYDSNGNDADGQTDPRIRTAREVAITIPSGDPDGDAHAAYTLIPTAYTSMYTITCADDDGCTLTLAEVDLGSVAIHGGHQITLVLAAANYHVDLADDGTSVQLAGAWAPTTAGDSITLAYSTSLTYWVEVGRSDN